jgi:hypothetical protein
MKQINCGPTAQHERTVPIGLLRGNSQPSLHQVPHPQHPGHCASPTPRPPPTKPNQQPRRTNQRHAVPRTSQRGQPRNVTAKAWPVWVVGQAFSQADQPTRSGLRSSHFLSTRISRPPASAAAPAVSAG